MESQCVTRAADDPFDPDIFRLEAGAEQGQIIVHRFGYIIFPRTGIADAAVDDDDIAVIWHIAHDMAHFGNDQIFAIVQGRYHGFTRNPCGLQKEYMDDHGNGQCYNNGIKPFQYFMQYCIHYVFLLAYLYIVAKRPS